MNNQLASGISNVSTNMSNINGQMVTNVQEMSEKTISKDS